MKKPWPRLSETLPLCEPMRCGQCGETEENCTSDIRLWQEHDASDRPEPIWFWLCQTCSDRIIEPHPRLYECVSEHAPAPGAMRICSDCPHRHKTRCSCPAAKLNGGPGILVNAVQPLVMHIDGRDSKGRRFGNWHKSYALPPSGCSGKTPWPPPGA
jgi:hypothetical protein